MAKHSTPKRKEDILETLVFAFEQASEDMRKNPDDPYIRGRYTEILDILRMIPIYEKRVPVHEKGGGEK